ncbi:type II toxin-antitoxin system VapC family toxin [Sphaerisporangium sp. NBC_01403]|uniref:type II toxin-antitoxin system VapC family toxin n=1 Tax=Sphaerisporangium sp. NBC_01403 TaxID=2903599 RepID=UPI003248E47A
MRPLLCDSGPLIATYNDRDKDFARCARLLAQWPGKLLVPEPVLGETCNFLRNHVRNGPALEIQFLEALTDHEGDFEIITPEPDDRVRAVDLARRLVTGPLGYVDGIVLAMAERLQVSDIATVDFKFLGMASPVSRVKPIRWVLQES